MAPHRNIDTRRPEGTESADAAQAAEAVVAAPAAGGARRKSRLVQPACAVVTVPVLAVLLLLCITDRVTRASGQALEATQRVAMSELNAQFNLSDGDHPWDLVLNAPCSQWPGVSCDANGFVIAIEVSESDAMFAFPTSIGALTRLTKFSANPAVLSGSIPDQFSRLTKLVYLDLGYAALKDGAFPSTFTKLTQLTFLDISHCPDLTSVPTPFSALKELLYLNLFYNQNLGQSAFMNTLSQLTKLTFLDLGYLQLTDFPTKLTVLANLRDLSLAQNGMAIPLPASITNLQQLTALNLNTAGFTGTIPPAIGNFANLRRLSIAGNSLRGQIPPTLSNLTALTELRLSSNLLSGNIPPSLGSLTGLSLLSLASNAFDGPLPRVLLTLKRLTFLDLGNNAFTGTLTVYNNSFPSASGVNLQGNYLFGQPNIRVGRGETCETGGVGVDGNCLDTTRYCRSTAQRSKEDCLQFCGTPSSFAMAQKRTQCGGLGICYFTPTGGSALGVGGDGGGVGDVAAGGDGSPRCRCFKNAKPIASGQSCTLIIPRFPLIPPSPYCTPCNRCPKGSSCQYLTNCKGYACRCLTKQKRSMWTKGSLQLSQCLKPLLPPTPTPSSAPPVRR